MTAHMRARLLILCPGQGGQHAAMFDLARSDARAAALLERLNVRLEPETLFTNRAAQPLVVAASLAMWEAIRGFAPAPALVAGYSVGELSAYGVAGALTAEQAVALAATRAALMDACVEIRPGQALAAISGLAPARVRALIGDDNFMVAIENGEDGCIVGGPADGLEALAARIAAAGARLARLPVEVASHTPYMTAAVAPFAAALGACAFQPQRIPVLSGIAACKVEGKAAAVEHLSRQLAEKIVWMDCMDACAEAGITVALELGPGAALARMLQARHPAIACRSVADFRTVDGIRQWLQRQAILA